MAHGSTHIFKSTETNTLHLTLQVPQRCWVAFSKTHLLKDCLIWLLSLSPGGFSNLLTKGEKLVEQKNRTKRNTSIIQPKICASAVS